MYLVWWIKIFILSVYIIANDEPRTVSSGLYCPRAGIVSCVLNRLASKNGDRMLPWKLTGTASSSSCCLRQTIGLSNSVNSGMLNRQSSCRRGSPRDTWRVWGSVCIRTPAIQNAAKRTQYVVTNDGRQRKVTACFIQHSRRQYRALRKRAPLLCDPYFNTELFIYVTLTNSGSSVCEQFAKFICNDSIRLSSSKNPAKIVVCVFWLL